MASGDISWLMSATALVMLMTPALGFFYGGLVRKKNLVSTIVQCLIIFALVSIIWAVLGYSLVFGTSTYGIIGDLSLVGLNTIGVHCQPSARTRNSRTTILRVST
jgi:Amt family ammonium transporter